MTKETSFKSNTRNAYIMDLNPMKEYVEDKIVPIQGLKDI